MESLSFMVQLKDVLFSLLLSYFISIIRGVIDFLIFTSSLEIHLTKTLSHEVLTYQDDLLASSSHLMSLCQQ